MADNTIKIDVGLEESFKEAKELFKELKNFNVFKGEKGGQDLTKIAGAFAVNESLFKKGNVTKEEINIIAKGMKTIFDTINLYATKIQELSPKAQWYQNKLNKANIHRNKRQAETDDLKESIIDKKKSIYQELEDKGIRKITKSGALSKTKLSGQTIFKKFLEGDISDLGFLGENGQVQKVSNKDFASVKELNNLEQELKDSEIILAKVNNEVEKWNNNLLHQLDLDVNEGNPKAIDIMKRTTKAKGIAEKGISKTTDRGIKEKGERVDNPTSLDANALKKQETSLGKAFKQFTIYNLAVRLAKKALSEAIQTITELDKSLTEQAMVTGLTREQTYGLVKSYQDLAVQVGATTKEVAQVATEYMKQGKSIKDSLTLTEAAVSAAKVARVSVGDSVNYLTTALNGFRLSADQAMRVSDKFASVAAASATDYDELAIALSKVASQANLAGMSIDYTTALLTKGLETTREAPETMGTALKTIIARMREMKDYGETLEGDTDINNVESQLKYVDIALRNQQGELRSTEDVLDELGKKWDTLNKNQQAAIAKALAGTRQQSRLIAMMDGYERVTELQEIALRSAGATSSQAEVYLEGMEASINRVRVAWEKIVTTVTDSEVLIGIVNGISKIMDFFLMFISNTPGMIFTVTTLGSLALTALGHKMMEWDIAKEQAKLANQQLIVAAKQELAQKRINFLKEQGLKSEQEKARVLALEQKMYNGESLTLLEQQELKGFVDRKRKNGKIFENSKEISGLNETISVLEGKKFDTRAILYPFQSLKNMLSGLGERFGFLKKKTDAAGVSMKLLNLTTMGWVAVASAAVLAIAGITTAIVRNNNSVKNITKNVKKMSSEMFKANKKADELHNIVDSYDAIDKKVIKTSKDIKDMNSQLEKAKDILTEEELEEYNALTSDKAKRDYLNNLETARRTEARGHANDIIKDFGKVRTAEQREKLWESASNVDAVRTINNMNLYDQIDSMTDLTKNQRLELEKTTQAILDEMGAEEAWALMNNKENLKSLTSQLQNSGVASVLNNDDSTLNERVEAYKNALEVLTPQNAELFKKAYSELEFFANDLNDKAIEVIDKLNLTNDAINDIYGSFEMLRENGLSFSSDEEYKNAVSEFFSMLKDDASNFGQALELTLGVYADSDEELNILINSISNNFATGILDMGQNMDKFKNSINSFYETASKWNTMNETEKTKFMSENEDLFSNNNLLSAFESGDYAQIEAALGPQMKDRLKKQLAEVRRTLAVERQRKAEDRNEAYIKQLEEYEEYLTNEEDLFKASLDIRLKQETDQLKEYKDYLKDQQDALKESLDNRKQAYQDYFNAIDKEEADEEYEEKANTLSSNLVKLSSSTDAKSLSQTKELTKQLEELEKDRLKELRSRARDAVMDSMDDNIKQINDKFDKLLENNQALLLAMKGDLKDPTKFVSNLIGNKINSGASALEVEKYIQGLQTTYGSAVGNNVDWKNVSVEERNNNLVLNIAGQEVSISKDNQQSLFETIMTALKQIGLR